MGYRLRNRLSRLARGIRARPRGERRLLGLLLSGCALGLVALGLIILAPGALTRNQYAAWFAFGLGSWLATVLLIVPTAALAVRSRRWAWAAAPLLLAALAGASYLAAAVNDPPQISTPAPPALQQPPPQVP